MKLDKLTMKSQELIQSAHELARRKNHTAIEPVHLLNGLTEDRQGVGAAILKKNRGRHVRGVR
jgi:ATP-dependent Clp protease ATP-binding subunit ClpB